MKFNPPKLIVFFGLPGTGKTTLAHGLSQQLKLPHFNTDMIRDSLGKRHAYSATDKAAIYAEMLRLTAGALEKGNSVVLDGTFFKKNLRDQITEVAQKQAASIKWVEVLASEAVVKRRVSKTRPYSEADYAVYRKIKKEFEPVSGEHLKVCTDREPMEHLLDQVTEYLSL